ncbi:uncharacterized protein LOC116033448 [Ipomoea triloba]|uniref:uncharacterized protein LOC116033448 n=1 Tax=Ipomoea triloba TaxID=35885 RepID=UPI00125E9BEE|nr:uncharacterized protein LOC116033448 [Ipomoea triloba]
MMLDKLEISMPFVDVVTQILSYKKFLKDILSNKKKLEKSAVVDLSEGALTCAVLQQKLPPKLKDPGSFTIPCIIGGFVVGSALCDLGASVSLMPYSLCKRLNLGNPKPTTMTLQMADRSIKRPVGVLEDIPVMVDQYFIPGDFVILDMEEDTKRGKLVMEVAGHKIEFDIFKMAKHQPSYINECHMVGVLEQCSAEVEEEENEDSSEPVEEEHEDSLEIVVSLAPFEEEQAPKVELKPLPSSLGYAFLGSSSTYPVIRSSSLEEEQVERLFAVLNVRNIM